MTSSTRPATDRAAEDAVVTGLEVAVGECVACSPWGRFARVFDADPGDGDGDSHVSEKELLGRLGDAEGLITQLVAAQGRLLLELRERRLATQQREAVPDGHAPGSCTRGC